MATPTWPAALRPSRVEWHLRANTGMAVSPFDQSIETQERPGARWVATLVYDNWTRAHIAEYEAFLASLRGSAGRFYLWRHDRENPLGSYSTVSPPETRLSMNQLLWSEAIDNAVYTKINGISVVPDQAIAPDGTLSGDKIIAGATADPYVYQNVIYPYNINDRGFTFSAWIWTDIGQPLAARIWLYDAGYVYADGSLIDVVISDTPTRFSVHHVFQPTTISNGITYRINLSTTPSDGDYIYAWGLMAEERVASYPFSYVKTTDQAYYEPYSSNQIDTVHWTPNENGLLLPGDMIEISGEQKIIISSVDSDENGLALMEFEPPIRANPMADNQSVNALSPIGLYMLASDDVGSISVNGSLNSFSINVVEAF